MLFLAQQTIVVVIRIWSTRVAKSGRVKILELLFWSGIFKILNKTLGVWGVELTLHA